MQQSLTIRGRNKESSLAAESRLALAELAFAEHQPNAAELALKAAGDLRAAKQWDDEALALALALRAGAKDPAVLKRVQELITEVDSLVAKGAAQLALWHSQRSLVWLQTALKSAEESGDVLLQFDARLAAAQREPIMDRRRDLLLRVASEAREKGLCVVQRRASELLQ